jgi:hypothetical protein
MKRLIIQFRPTSYYFIPLRFKYSPHHPVLSTFSPLKFRGEVSGPLFFSDWMFPYKIFTLPIKLMEDLLTTRYYVDNYMKAEINDVLLATMKLASI